jgi:sugar/nucleoside kinase (ribokinase family)
MESNSGQLITRSFFMKRKSDFIDTHENAGCPQPQLENGGHETLRRPKDLVIIGDVFCDIIALDVKLIDSWGTDTLSKEIRVLAGGSALNIAVHGANYSVLLGSHVKIRFFSETGNDFQGDVCRRALNHLCIDSSNLNSKIGNRTGSCIVLSGATDRSFVTDRACIKDLSLNCFEEKDYLSESNGHIHIGGFYNCDTLQAEVPELLRRAKSMGMTTSLNPQYDATDDWGWMQAICPYLTFFIGNDAELASVVKSKVCCETLVNAAILLNWGCVTVIVTLGDRGVLAFQRKAHSLTDCCTSEDIECCSHPALDVDVVDTTGAGDAFVGGFLVEWMMSQQLSSSLKAGCVAAGAAVTQVGGSSSNLASLEQVSKKSPLVSM